MRGATESLLPVQQGHLASLDDGLDFVNTYHLAGSHRRVRQTGGLAHDHLDSPASALEWFASHDLMHSSARDNLLKRYEETPQEGQEMLGRLRRLRTAMRGVLVSAVERRPADLADLAEINRAMRTHYIYELVPATDGISLEHRHQGDPVDGAMSRLAESVARELIQGMPERLRICDNPTCREVFKDSSRTGRKRWCDMSTCGNRAKVARHRARLRSELASAPQPGGN
jgi:predicted RNA-binding Zn ribbon-like protein